MAYGGEEATKLIAGGMDFFTNSNCCSDGVATSRKVVTGGGSTDTRRWQSAVVEAVDVRHTRP